MAANDALFTAFEYHSPEKIRAALSAGADASRIDGLIEMYSRSPRFSACIQTMLDAGAKIGEPVLQCVLLDDAAGLRSLLTATPDAVHRRISLKCTFTPLRDVTALHVAAEYNALGCAQVLLEGGADPNAASGTDSHTPVFHTVNSPGNFTRQFLELLVNAGARLDIHVKELIWGEGFEWETAIFDVTPISYAQCGLLPQFQRNEADIFGNIAWMYERRHGAAPAIRNVPNKYLRKG